MPEPSKSLLQRAQEALMDPEVNPLGAPGLIKGLQTFVQPVTSVFNQHPYSPDSPAPPGTDYAVQQSASYGDTIPAATTLGVKPRSYAKGTPYVPATGIYKLHRGEAVIPRKDNPVAQAKMGDALKKSMGNKMAKKSGALAAKLGQKRGK